MNPTYFVQVDLLAKLGQSKTILLDFIYIILHEGLLPMKLRAFEYCQRSMFCRTINDCFFSLQLHRVPLISLISQELIPLH